MSIDTKTWIASFVFVFFVQSGLHLTDFFKFTKLGLTFFTTAIAVMLAVLDWPYLTVAFASMAFMWFLGRLAEASK